VSEEARQLTELAQRKNRILQVGHIFRFDPASQWLRDAIRAGQFGKLQILRSNFSGFKRPRNDSGVMFADAVHFVDLFNYFMEKKPARVFAANKDFMARGMEDASLLSLEYQTGDGVTWGTVETNYFLPGKFREVTVIGSEMSAVCDYDVAQYKIKTFANRHVKEGNEYKAVEGTLHQIESPPEEPLQAQVLLDAWEVGSHQWTSTPLQLREGPSSAPAQPVPRDAVELFRLLQERKVKYLLVGGLAVLTYVQGRNTKDVDLLLSVEALEKLPELKIRDRNKFFAKANFRSVQVDLLLTEIPCSKLSRNALRPNTGLPN
jgi:predicted dehydrogenase